MVCGEIHSDDPKERFCSVVMQSDWVFCPRCGRKGGAVSLPSAEVTFSASRLASLALRHRGQQAVEVRVVLPSAQHAASGQAPDLQLLNASDQAVPKLQMTVKPDSLSRLRLRWSVDSTPPPRDSALARPLLARSDDGFPRSGFEARDERWRIWSPLDLRVARSDPGRLRLETSVCLFDGRTSERDLWLFNEGGSRLRVRPPRLPAGYEVSQVISRASASGSASGAPNSTLGASLTLEPGEGAGWRIRASHQAPPGEARCEILRDDGNAAPGQVLGSVRLLNARPPAVRSHPRWVVGVDFGTSGTSIWARPGANDKAAAQPLEDPHALDALGEDRFRFPTVIYVRNAGGGEEFFIGYRALRERAKDGPNTGLFVSELKSLLRSNEEPYVAQWGPNYSVDLLLQRYLEALRQEIIEPSLGPENAIAWNFSLPVLDSHRGGAGTLHKRQKGRLRKALREAGFLGPNCTVEFFSEPFCAAVYLLLGHGSYRFPAERSPRDGDWVCVFDSGGGTTDVVLGRLWFDNGELRFEEAATLGGYRDAHGEVNTFGGEALTRRTAIYLSVWDPTNSGADPKYNYSQALRLSVKQRQELRDIAVQAATQGDEALVLAKDAQGRAVPTLWAQAEALREVDRFKRQLAGLGTPRDTAIITSELARQGASFKHEIVRSEFDDVVVNRRLQPMLEAMRTLFAPPLPKAQPKAAQAKAQPAQSALPLGDAGDVDAHSGSGDVLPSPREVQWIFGVGGNCNVSRINESLHSFFSRAPQDLRDAPSAGGAGRRSDRMLAVSGGAVWAATARHQDAVPYTLLVLDESTPLAPDQAHFIGAVRGKVVCEIQSNDVFSDGRERGASSYSIEPGQSVRLSLVLKGQWSTAPASGASGGAASTCGTAAFEGRAAVMEVSNPLGAAQAMTIATSLLIRREAGRWQAILQAREEDTSLLAPSAPGAAGTPGGHTAGALIESVLYQF